jgi:murein DD-endopeptidase MepM/ murein hydrolase activator NlpD
MTIRTMHRLRLMILLLCTVPCGVLHALELEGPLTQGGVVIGRVAPGTPVALDGKALRVSPEGLFVIGFDRDAPRTQTLRAGSETRELAIARREYRIQKVTGIPQRIMEPTPDDLARIEREQQLVTAARERDDARTDFAAGFAWPITGPISGVYGSQRFYNGEPSRPHFGVDVAAPVGATVRAPAPGLVTLAEGDLFYSGGIVIIDHGHQLSSSFLHLSKVLVKAGQQVARGDVIAEVGATGRATGPHLDWRMNWRDARVDPELLAGPMPRPATPEKAVGDSP